SMTQPVVRRLHLRPVADALEENPVFIADAIPIRRKRQCRHRIQKAGGKTPQAAIAKARVVLALFKLLEPTAHLRHGALDVTFEPQVDDGIAQGASDEKLQ